MKIPRVVWIVSCLIVVGGGVFAVSSRPRMVDVTKPVSMLVTETIAASGRLRGQTESSIGASNGGRVAQIFVREGDKVKANQTIARMNDEVLSAQIIQAQAALQTAREQVSEAEASVQTATAQLWQAARPPLTSDVERLGADNEQSVRTARAKLESARQHESGLYQHYLAVRRGTRSEEVEQARTQVQQAEINLVQLERDYNRQQSLYRANAVARADVEKAESNFLVGKQTLGNAQSRLQQLQAGNRVEDIAQAEADYRAAHEDVISAEASLTGARRSGDAQMRSLLATPRPEDVAVAKQRLEQEIRSREVARERMTEAQTALTLARKRYDETRITAPFAGTVTQVVTEAGAITGQNTPILRLVRTGQPEIHVDLDEVNLGKLKLGQEALVTNDAFPDARFTARVTQIGAQVDTDRGTVEVRLVPIAPPDWIRPGQTFTVNIVLGTAQKQLVVPTSAVTNVGGVTSLLAVENGKVVRKSVKAAPLATRGIPILEGIDEETKVVVDPGGLIEGTSVSVRNRD